MVSALPKVPSAFPCPIPQSPLVALSPYICLISSMILIRCSISPPAVLKRRSFQVSSLSEITLSNFKLFVDVSCLESRSGVKFTPNPPPSFHIFHYSLFMTLLCLTQSLPLSIKTKWLLLSIPLSSNLSDGLAERTIQ